MKNHGRVLCGVRTHDPEVARQTPDPLGYRSLRLESRHLTFTVSCNVKPEKQQF